VVHLLALTTRARYVHTPSLHLVSSNHSNRMSDEQSYPHPLTDQLVDNKEQKKEWGGLFLDENTEEVEYWEMDRHQLYMARATSVRASIRFLRWNVFGRRYLNGRRVGSYAESYVVNLLKSGRKVWGNVWVLCCACVGVCLWVRIVWFVCFFLPVFCIQYTNTDEVYLRHSVKNWKETIAGQRESHAGRLAVQVLQHTFDDTITNKILELAGNSFWARHRCCLSNMTFCPPKICEGWD
jgi:hypothetical protein